MKQSKSISKVGWIPLDESIRATWCAAHCYQVKRRDLALNRREAKIDSKVGDSPRKVRVTLTLTVEDVK